MPGAFSYQSYPQRPAPAPSQVGQMLAQGGPMGGPGMASPGGEMAPPPPDPAALRAMGGLAMGGPGQTNDDPVIPNTPGSGAMAAAVGEHLTRMGGGYMTSPNPYKDRGRASQRLLQHGLSDGEVALLMQSGGF